LGRSPANHVRYPLPGRFPVPIHIQQLGDDLRNARAAQLNLIVPILAPRLPPRQPLAPHTMNVMGNVQSVIIFTRPTWQGNVRVVVGRDDLITIDVIEPDGRFAEIWRSDAPMVVSAPRRQEEMTDETADIQ
jgi:hypothetical protein